MSLFDICIETARLILRPLRCSDFDGFTELFFDVIHCSNPVNAPSQRLAARVGSRKLRPGRLPAPFADATIDIRGQSREEWLAGQTKQDSP